MGTGRVTEVENTLRVFYNGTTPEEQRQRAHSWLVELQDSKSAWEVALLLLDQSQVRVFIQQGTLSH